MTGHRPARRASTRRKQTRCGPARGDDRGQAIVQFAAAFPIAVLAVLFCFKLFVVITAVERVNNAARDGARAASLAHDPSACRPTALNSLPDWLSKMAGPQDHLPDKHPLKPPHTRVEAIGRGGVRGGVSCEVIAKIPLLWSSVDFNYNVDRTVRMPG